MLQSTTRPLRFLPLIALTAGILVSAICSSSVRADNLGNTKVGDVRLGLYYLASDGVRSDFTSSIASAGLDFNLGEVVGTSRTQLGVDYISRTSGSSKLQIIPVTISEQYYHTIGGTDFTPYGEAGIGAYFVSINESNDPDLATTNSETSLGGFIGVGLDINTSLFIDARYHLIGNIKSQNPSGYEFTVGLRF